jgi:hypothetical protein
MKLVRPAITIVLLFGAATCLAHASTFLRLGVEDLARQADGGILVGRVVDSRSSWNDARTMVWTEVTVVVHEDLARGGGVGESRIFRVPGGRVGDVEIRMHGAPELVVGDQVVLFGTAWPDGSNKVLGYFQGLSSVRTAGDGRLVLRGGSADGMTMEELRRAVRTALATGGAS